MPERLSVPSPAPLSSNPEFSISLAREVIERFQLTDLYSLLRTVELQTQKRELNLAVFGRFKAGKSSFLNHVIGRSFLPVGVVPATSVITEISYGPEESASVVFQTGRGIQNVSPTEIGCYISESENPGNRKAVEIVRVSLPHLSRFPGLKFVDTPGLESTFSQNTEASLSWSPNVDLALVAVAVDPPLTQQDIALIERLHRFTPNVSVLLTKMDTLEPAGQQEVLAFVEAQLTEKFPGGLRVFPFSIRPGYKHLHERFEREYLSDSLVTFRKQLAAALIRKLQTLLETTTDYLLLALKSAEAQEKDREDVRTRVLGSEQSLADWKLQFQLLAKHAVAATRPVIERNLQRTALPQLQQKLAARLASEFPQWRGSFARTLSQFEDWLSVALNSELSAISATECDAFKEPLRDLRRQYHQSLQLFRDELSEKVLRTFGVPLRTTEAEIELQPPRTPDISIGKIFDHNWELISAVIPMSLFRDAVKRRLDEKIESEVFKNCSRLTSQWEEVIRAAIHAIEREAGNRLNELVLTVRRLLSSAGDGSKPELLSYLDKLRVVSQRFPTVAQDSSWPSP